MKKDNLNKFENREIENFFGKMMDENRRCKENMNLLMDPQPLGCNSDGSITRVRFVGMDWEKNQRGQIHGGAIAAMFDTAMGISASAFTKKDVSTAELTVSFIRPFYGAGYIIDTEILSAGRTLIRARANAYDEDTGKLLASATGSFAYLYYAGSAADAHK